MAERDLRLPDGTPTWASLECGLVVSRQNGKGSILEARELAGLFLFNEKMIIHSAHAFDTSLEAFRRLKNLIEGSDELSAQVRRIVNGHGEEGIELRNGNRIRFRTRSKGGGRGFTADCIILDEAMFLTTQQMQALMFTVSARPNVQIFYMGSAGDKQSEHFGRVRSRGVKAEDPRLTFAEWSIDACTDFCPADCEDHDQYDTVESYAKSNPGLGIRISVEHIESERRSMDREAFAMERLGVGDWPVDGEAWRVIGEDSWRACYDPLSGPVEHIVFSVDVSPDRSHSAIAVAGFNGEGMMHVEVTRPTEVAYDHRPGTAWVMKRLKDIRDKHGANRFCVAIDKGSQAGSFMDDLEKENIEVISPTTREYAQACGAFHSRVVPRSGNKASLTHRDQKPLNLAVAGAETRELSDVWAWDKRNASCDITPLVAATVAAWGSQKKASSPVAAAWAVYG